MQTEGGTAIREDSTAHTIQIKAGPRTITAAGP
jgi:hypothetical protein